MNTVLWRTRTRRATGVLALTLLLVFGIANTGWAERPNGLQKAETQRVRAVVDGDTVALGDGREVRLVGIQAPKLPLGRRGFRKWPLADEAKEALEGIARGKVVSLSYGGRRMDRHGRALAHLHLEDGTWIQEEMLKRGLARVYTFPDNRAAVPALFKAERAARAARRGIWAHPYYRILRDREAGRHLNSFQLVEGRVAKVASTRGWVYLNFGRDWRRDFTIAVPRRALRLFDGRDDALTRLEGKRVRVRGWLRRRNGPMIVATHPEQIERLEGR